MMGTHVSSVPVQGESGDGESTGLGWEGVDRSTLQLIANLFPAQTCGRAFFARFFARAAVEKSVIPDVTKDTVYICTQSIASLGEELGLSNDTTQKYVKLYTALGLLRKQKFMDKLTFLLFVGIYHPPQTLESNLDFLIQKSRPRLHDMAVDVKARCQIYGLISQDLVSSLEQLQALLHVEKGTSRCTLEQRLVQAQYITSKVLKVVLRSHLSAEAPLTDGTSRRKENTPLENLPKEGDVGDDTHHQENQESTRQNLLKAGKQVDSPPCRQDRESPQSTSLERFSEEDLSPRLPGSILRVDSVQTVQDGESPQYGTSSRFEEKHGSAGLAGSLSWADSGQHEQERESTREGEPGRFSKDCVSSRLPQRAGGGDSDQGDQHAHLAESTQEGIAGRREDDHLRSNLPNLLHRVDSGGVLRNVYVDSIYKFISTYTLREPQRVAEFLAEQLEGDRRVYPKYQKLFHVQERQARDPHVLAAAFVCTMVRWHRDQWNISNRPGGFFTKRCREYDTEVPQEVEEWITSYGQLSPAALLEALTKQGRPGHTPVPVAPVQQPYQKPAPRPLLPPLAFSPKLQVEPTRMVMSKSEAQALIQAVLHDHRTQLFRTRCLRIGKEASRYAVLVDASVPGGLPHQTVVYSCAEWQARLEAMKTWRDLIYPPRSGPPRADLGKTSQGEETSR